MGVLSSDLSDGQVVETLGGENAAVDPAPTPGVPGFIQAVIDEGSITPEPSTSPAPLDIVQTAIDAGSFNTLVAALTAADLVGALSAPNGPYTVFAPTDDAFAALPSGLVECLLQPENRNVLSSILLYHVVSGQVLSSDLSNGLVAETLSGEDVTVDLTSGVKINTSPVSAADILASNGVIHVIDSVLVPSSVDVAAFLSTC